MERHEPLMETLGRQGKVALVRETEEEWELVIPHDLLAALSTSERVPGAVRNQRIPSHRWLLSSEVTTLQLDSNSNARLLKTPETMSGSLQTDPTAPEFRLR